MKKPASIYVIGWLFVAVGTLTGCAAFRRTLVSLVLTDETLAHMREFEGKGLQADDPRAIDLGWRLSFSMVEYVKLVAVVKFFVAVSAILGGVAFLRLRSWSRYLLQALCWLWIVYAVGFSVPLLRSVPPVAFWGALDWKAGTYFMLTLVTGLLMLAGFIVPAVVIIFALRGQTVGGAMTPDSKEAAV